MGNMNRPSKYKRKAPNISITAGIHLGFVRNTADTQRMGRLDVWVPELGPDQEQFWVTVSYASPFAGATDLTNSVQDDKTETGTQKSYGWWAVPPDVGNQVLICFANNDVTRGYWFGCSYAQNMNHMVPGIGSNSATDTSVNQQFAPYSPPTTEYNKKDTSVSPDSAQRPHYSALSDALIAQGLHKDPERGVSSSSARREDTSKVIGLLSPGGSSFVLDDADDNQFIRFRTKSGTQILISETSGFIYMVTKGGNSWMEISDGGVDVYSKSPISMRSEDDINIQADGDLNIDANKDINIRSGGTTRIHSMADFDIKSEGRIASEAGGKYSIVADGDLALKSQGKAGIQSGGDTVFTASGTQYRNGSSIKDNGGGSPPSPDTPSTKNPVSTSNGSRATIVSIAPTHEPFSHPISKSSSDITRADGSVINAQATADGSPTLNVKGFKVSQNVYNCIKKAADQTGVPFGALMGIAAQESTFKPNAGASTSSAKGLYQFTNSTWSSMYSKYGPNGTVSKNSSIQNNPYDACSNALMGAYYYKQNQSSLQKAGVSSGPTEVYMAHFLGPAGANKFLRALASNPNAPSSSAVSSSAYSANQSVFNGRTVQQVYNFYYGKIGATESQWDNVTIKG